MKKLLFILLCILFVNSLYAKSLVYIPTAVSADGIFLSYDNNLDESSHTSSVTGGMNGLELNVTNYSNQTDEGKYFSVGKTILNAQWQILPEMGMVPSVAVGAKDLTCGLSHSPSFYGVVTKNFAGYIPLDKLERLSATIGVGNDSLGFFGGLDLKYDFIYGSFEAYKKGLNYSCGLTFLDDCFKFGYKRFNNNNYIGVEIGFALNY